VIVTYQRWSDGAVLVANLTDVQIWNLRGDLISCYPYPLVSIPDTNLYGVDLGESELDEPAAG